MPLTTSAYWRQRPNRFSGRCALCGHEVAELSGIAFLRTRNDHRWETRHHPDQCPSVQEAINNALDADPEINQAIRELQNSAHEGRLAEQSATPVRTATFASDANDPPESSTTNDGRTFHRADFGIEAFRGFTNPDGIRVRDNIYVATPREGANDDIWFFKVVITRGGGIVVYRVIGGERRGQYVGRQARGRYYGQFQAPMQRILADIDAAIALYGREIGRCGICGRTLTDAESRARGIGPDCYRQYVQPRIDAERANRANQLLGRPPITTSLRPDVSAQPGPYDEPSIARSTPRITTTRPAATRQPVASRAPSGLALDQLGMGEIL